jgi:Zn-finger nucleic acid-binding protein
MAKAATKTLDTGSLAMNKTLHCSCAAHTELIACKLAPGLKGLHCTSCDGHMLMLEDYRVWRSTAPAQPATSATATAEDNSARHCPACTRLMQRYRVGSTPDFWVDRCASCQAVWFAGGEWQALLAAGMGTRLDDILTDAWQRQVQAEELRKAAKPCCASAMVRPPWMSWHVFGNGCMPNPNGMNCSHCCVQTGKRRHGIR